MVGAFPAGGCEEAGGNYLFQMLPDCQPNGIADHIDVDPIEGKSDDLNENGIPDECEGFDPCSCDWDDDGMVEVEDIFDFLTDWFANDPDALNYGGTPGVAAIFAFLTCWFAADLTGPCDP